MAGNVLMEVAPETLWKDLISTPLGILARRKDVLVLCILGEGKYGRNALVPSLEVVKAEGDPQYLALHKWT